MIAAAQSVMFGGNTFARYTLVSEGVGQTRQRRQGNSDQLRSTLIEELGLRFRTEAENGLLFLMTTFSATGDTVSILVRTCLHRNTFLEIELQIMYIYMLVVGRRSSGLPH